MDADGLNAPAQEPSAIGLYERVIGQDWARLPRPLRQLHGVTHRGGFAGEARVEAGRGFLAACVRRLIGFPRAAQRVEVRVTIERRGKTEHWTREFGSQRLCSTLEAAEDSARGVIVERFGTLSFRMTLPVDANGLAMPVQRAEWLGMGLPRWLTPNSRTRECVDEQGRFCFDVDIGLPGIGRVVRYRGWLLPVVPTESAPPALRSVPFLE